MSDKIHIWLHVEFLNFLSAKKPTKTIPNQEPANPEPEPMHPDEDILDSIYGTGMRARVTAIINDLAPNTRRDEWWETDGPYEILAKHLSTRGDE